MEKQQIDSKHADFTNTWDLSKIDNLGRMECLDLIVTADEWLQMRGLRNRLVHEYFDRPENLAPEYTCRFTERMHTNYSTIRAHASKRFGIASPR